MIRSLYTAVSGLVTGEAKQSVISNNIANANTVGFKGEDLSMKSFEDVLVYNYDKLSGNRNVRNNLGTINLGSKIDEVNTFFTQGMIQSTGKDTDFAIEGPGFFTVKSDTKGGTFYTRNGHFHVNLKGNLVTDSDDTVLGKNKTSGAMEPINVGNEKIKVDRFGNIKVNDVNKYSFATVDFNDYKSLKKVGDNLYEGTNPIQKENVLVRQQALEKSNVNVISEMIEMMTVMRGFESNQKVVQVIDETLGKSVNELGSLR